MTDKITKKQMYEALINFANGGNLEYTDEKKNVTIEVTDEVLRKFAENELSILARKAEKAKENAAKKRNKPDVLYDIVKSALKEDFMTIADITEEIVAAGYADVTIAKVTYRLSKLVEAGEAEKAPIKIVSEETKKTRTVNGYRLVGAEE